MSLFTGPKISPCFHTFCLRCLNELQRTNDKHGEITCPECRRKFQVPGSGYPKDLTANFRMNSLLDVMGVQKFSLAELKCAQKKTAKKQVPKVVTVLNAAPFGATIALQLITLSEPIKTTECWRLRIFKMKTFKTCWGGQYFARRSTIKRRVEFFCKDREFAIHLCYNISRKVR